MKNETKRPERKHLLQIIGKLESQDINILGDADRVESCLSQCVAAQFCLKVAAWIRANMTEPEVLDLIKEATENPGIALEPTAPSVEGIAINLRKAAFDRQSVTIAGGIFEREELKAAAAALQAFPEMLEALRRIENICKGLQSVETEQAYKEARNAITKATGAE